MTEDIPPPAKKPPRKQEALWLMSFSDMSLVLMCFFVLLLSMSTVDAKRFDHVTDSLQSEVSERTKESLQDLFERIQQEIRVRKLQKKVEASYTNDGIHVEFKDGSLYASGSAKTNKQMAKTVNSVLEIIADAPAKYELEIEGHTDDVPLRGHRRYRNNWELSAARSITLMKQLARKGVREDRMGILALAHTRPKIDPSGLKGGELRRARASNRRVIINID